MVISMKTLGLGLVSAAVLVSATPVPAPELAAALEGRTASCTFTDAAAAFKGKSKCSTIVLSGIKVPAGVTLDMTKLNKGTKVVFEGTTTWGYEEWSGPLFAISGDSVTVTGSPGHVLDGNGAKWWDGLGGNGGKTKPKFFSAHSLKSSLISNLNVKNTPVQAFSINTATSLTLDKITIDNSAGDVGKKGHNTDAFDVGASKNIVISNANVKNQDDCLAINSGTNITVTGCICSGGHGLSIGSVGGRSDNTVSNVKITSSSVLKSTNGLRIKTVSGATGSVSAITYSDIKLSGITDYGIVIQQDYKNGSPTGKPTTGVPITGLTMSNISGTLASSATEIYILCGLGSCSNWKWSNVALTGGKSSTKCLGIPSGVSI